MKTLKLLIAIGTIATIFSGCKGDTGPAGPTGASGVANISSNIFTVTPGQWGVVSGGYSVLETDGSITNSNSDGLEVFYTEINNGAWAGLPTTDALTNSGDLLNFAYNNGQILFIYLYSSPPAVTLYFKVVVIPPAIMKQHPNTDWHNYGQVQAIMDAQATIRN